MATPQPSQIKPRVLIADDDDDARILWDKLLCRSGHYTCVLVEDGQKAIEAYDKARVEGFPFALIMLDVMMPRKNGFQVAEHVRFEAQDNDTCIVIATGSPDHLTAPRAQYVHAVEVWQKPLDVYEFRSRIDYLVEQRSVAA